MAIAFSPMEQFELFPLFSLNITINNVIFYLLVASFISITITYVGSVRNKLVPSFFGILSESLYATILSMVDNYIGRKHINYAPLIYTIFHVILFSNLLG